MAEMRIVDGDGVVELREHPQEPSATAAGRAEDPDEAILAAGQAEPLVPRWSVHWSQRTIARPRYPLQRRGNPENATAPGPVSGAVVLLVRNGWGGTPGRPERS